MIFVLALCAALCSGCRAGRHIPPPVIPPELVSGAAKQNALAEIAARAHEIRSWRGLSRTLWRQEDRRARLRHAIVFSGTQRLRVETLPPGGAFTLNLLLLNGAQVLYLDAEKRIAVRSETPGRLLAEVLGVELSAVELMAYLTGRVPAWAGGAEDLFRNEAGGEILLRRGAHTFLFLDPLTYTLKRAHVRGSFDDRLRYEVECSAYKSVGGVPLPTQVTLSIPRKETTISLSLSNLAVNLPVAERLFSAAVPSDYRLEMY